MRRRIVLPLVTLVALGALLAGCGSGDDASTTATDGGADVTTTVPGVAVSCSDYERVLQLFGQTEEIATGSFDGQAQADQALADALAELGRSAEGDDALTGALDTLSQVSFQATDAATGPRPQEVDAALDTIDAAWGGACRSAVATTAPADGGATETTVVEADPGTTVTEDEGAPIECPAPEVLEAEGYACDSEGNLTPVE